MLRDKIDSSAKILSKPQSDSLIQVRSTGRANDFASQVSRVSRNLGSKSLHRPAESRFKMMFSVR